MPDHWKNHLQEARISKTEQKKNPQALIDALNYYETTAKIPHEAKFMQMKSGISSFHMEIMKNFNVCLLSSDSMGSPSGPDSMVCFLFLRKYSKGKIKLSVFSLVLLILRSIGWIIPVVRRTSLSDLLL